jgi:hypothetical protein
MTGMNEEKKARKLQFLVRRATQKLQLCPSETKEEEKVNEETQS